MDKPHIRANKLHSHYSRILKAYRITHQFVLKQAKTNGFSRFFLFVHVETIQTKKKYIYIYYYNRRHLHHSAFDINSQSTRFIKFQDITDLTCNIAL